MKNVVRPAHRGAKQRGLTRMGRPPAGASRAAWAAATMQLMGVIKMRGEGKSNAELETLLGLCEKDEDGLSEHAGRYFSRYLSGTAALHPNDLQMVAARAREKGLLRPPDLPRMVGTTIESLVGEPRTLLTETLREIQAERVALTRARQNALHALDELVRVMAECKTAALTHTIGDVGGDCAIDEGVGIDLTSVRAAIDNAYVSVFASRLIADLVPTSSGTNPAQLKRQKRSKVDAR